MPLHEQGEPMLVAQGQDLHLGMSHKHGAEGPPHRKMPRILQVFNVVYIFFIFLENPMPSFAVCHWFCPVEPFPKRFNLSAEIVKQNENCALVSCHSCQCLILWAMMP